MDPSLNQRSLKQQQQQQQHPWSQIGKVIVGDEIGSWSGEHLALSGDGSTLVVASAFTPSSSDGASSPSSRRGIIKIYRLKETEHRKKKNGLDWFQVGDDIYGVHVRDDDGNGESNGDGVNNVLPNSLKGINSIAVSYDGQMVAVGSIYDDAEGNEAGNVRTYRVYKNNNENGDGDNEEESWSWMRVGSVINGTYPGDKFGYSVSLSDNGKRMVVGATERDTKLYANVTTKPDTGRVQIYQLREIQVSGKNQDQGTTDWVEIGNSIQGIHENEEFGYAVSISGDARTIAIGAPSSSILSDTGDGQGDNERKESGVVRIYTESNNYSGGSQWVKIGSIPGIRENVNFGTKVQLSKDGKMLIGAATPKNEFSSTSSTTSTASYLSSQVPGYVQAYRVVDASLKIWIPVGNRLFARMKVPGIAPLSIFDVSSSSDANTVAVSYSSTSEDITKADLYGNVKVYHLTNTTANSDSNPNYDEDDTLAQRWEECGQNIQFLEITDEMKANQMVRDDFGFAVSLSGDSETIALGAPFGNLGVGTVTAYDVFSTPSTSSSDHWGFFLFSLLLCGVAILTIRKRRKRRYATLATSSATTMPPQVQPSSRLQTQSPTTNNIEMNQFPLGLKSAGSTSGGIDTSFSIGDLELV